MHQVRGDGDPLRQPSRMSMPESMQSDPSRTMCGPSFANKVHIRNESIFWFLPEPGTQKRSH